MKKQITKILLTVGVMFIFFNTTAQEVIYGTLRTDGYTKITKGAMWSKRPEAKKIYEGDNPPGFNVFILESDYFVRFVDGENNQFDRNYIVFPKGEKVYTDQSGNFYAAICGNRIEYIKSVNLAVIKEEGDQDSSNKMNDEKSTRPEVVSYDDGWQEESSPSRTVSQQLDFKDRLPSEQQNQQLKQVVDWVKVAKIGGFTVGVVGIGVLIYTLVDKKGKPNVIPGSPVDPTGPMDTNGP